VAPLGTALTPDQLRLLWGLAALPILCFDGDAAGQKAAHRALDAALPYLEPGRSLQFAFLPEGRDPDDMVRGRETEALAKLLAQSLPLIEVLWGREQARHPLETPEQRASLEARLMELAGQIGHRSLKYHYITEFRNRLRGAGKARGALGRGTPPSRGRGFRASGSPKPQFPALAARSGSLLGSKLAQPTAPITAPREALIIGAILRHPWLLDDFLEQIAELHLNDPTCRTLRDRLLAVHQAEENLDNEKLLEHLSREGYGAAVEPLEQATSHTGGALFARNASKELVLEGWHHVMMLHAKAGVPRSLQEAESDYLNEPTIENFSKLSEIRAMVQQIEIPAS
jgi:DNA primase